MALTREFRTTVKDRADRDPEFRDGILTAALEAVARGELDVAKILQRDYINATQGVEAVGQAVDKSPKSLMRMLGPSGTPNARHLFAVTRFLQQDAGLEIRVAPETTHVASSRSRTADRRPRKKREASSRD